ncbi:E3 ubiquitin-protein ligase [Phytophthora nicotianae]|uniref:E3 ubiquitin-protein ligase n=1 Tax=Phytophthora nicotianae TaxID=4792 RepID=A0A0W8DC95_PHYNI|nr:E3 ubiquitin-protein ligase [Phytophthora nicotianae]
MGRAPKFERLQFQDIGLPKQNNRKQLVCKHCLAAYNRQNLQEASKVVAARSTTFKTHLKSCTFYLEAVKSGQVQPPQATQVSHSVINGFKRQVDQENQREVASSASSDKRQRFIREYFYTVFTEDKHEEFERLLIQFQADNCLLVRFIEKGSTIRLFTFLKRACTTALPKRKEMGKILEKYNQVEEEEQHAALRNRMEFSGGRVNFLSDVWQNVAKMHLLGCMLALFGTILTFGLFKTGPRHDGVAIGEQMENVMENVTEKGWETGAVVSDDAGQCRRARCILALRARVLRLFIALRRI